MTTDEWAALVRAAGQNCRDPKQEARYLVRVGLGLTDQEKHNGAGIRQDTPRAVAAIAG